MTLSIPDELSLSTDLYELTMACGYWKNDMAADEAVFHLYFRRNPFEGGYAIAAGLAPVIDYLRALGFSDDDRSYLASLKGSDGKALFPSEFLQFLSKLRFTCDVDAMPEGTAAFPLEPIVRVRGPIIEAQLIETVLLTLIGHQSLIATKAARCVQSARGDTVIEFGLRRAHGIDGGLSASRAAFIGGCASTSNVLAGRKYGIPVRGTIAHSWVMAFDDELEAFEAYAHAMPANTILLVDTYDTLQGVRHAVEIGRQLRDRGFELGGIRLDSGDLAWLSIEARKILDAGGFPHAAIAATNDLDERIIASLKEQGAQITVWGVGTQLVTAFDQPALGCVYKLAAIRRRGGEWQPRIKLSEQTAKTTLPGCLQVRRFQRDGQFSGDMIFEESSGEVPSLIVDPADPLRRKLFDEHEEMEDLLVPVFRRGEMVYQVPTLAESQRRTAGQLNSFDPAIRRFLHPHEYPVGLSVPLHELRERLVLGARRRLDRLVDARLSSMSFDDEENEVEMEREKER
jgi:nicotinate phosphoribosyltransferase